MYNRIDNNFFSFTRSLNESLGINILGVYEYVEVFFCFVFITSFHVCFYKQS